MYKEKVIADAKYSVRSIDENGYLHVEMTPISKATVNPYKGSELQGLTDVQLEPDRIYYGYRDPKELEKGANTFNGLFLLDEHHEIDATSIPKEYIIGTVGTDAKFKDGYLYNSLVIADQEAINNVEDKSKWEISSAYKFVPVFKEGEVETEGGEKIHYDFVMTDIRGNHVALVPEGRAGHDVRVADSKGEIKKMDKKPICCADALKCELCVTAQIKTLQEIVDRVAGLNLDIEIDDILKNKAGKIIAVVMKNDGHTFNVGYDGKGAMQVSELISDDDAMTVCHAYTQGQMDAMEAHCKEHEMKEQAECIAKEKMATQTPSVVVVEQPSKMEEVVSAEVSPKPITEEVVSLIADTPAVVTDDNETMAETTELEHKDDEYDEKAFVDIKERFSNARFNNFDDFVKEIGKYGVSVGKVSVIESGSTYSAKCEKGQKVFTVEFKQTDCCVEVFKVYDENQIAESELDTEPSAETEVEKVVTTDKKVNRVRGKRVAKDKKVVKGKRVAKDGGPGSGRKPGSKNGQHKMTFTPAEKQSITARYKKAHPGYERVHSPKDLQGRLRDKEEVAGQMQKALEYDLSHNSSIYSSNREEAVNRRNKWKNHRETAAKLAEGLDAKKKVKGCVGDANPIEKGLVTDVFGLLMNVLGDNFGVQDGGPGSGNFGHGGRPGQMGGSGKDTTSNSHIDENADADFEAWSEKYGGNFDDPDEAFAAYEKGYKSSGEMQADQREHSREA